MGEQKRSFLLRLWQSDDTDETQLRWLASLQEVPDGKRIGFADIIELLTFFEALTQSEEAEADEEED